MDAAKKTLHSKRSFASKSMHQRPGNLDSPAYDASEEDNDPLTDDGASAISLPIHTSRLTNNNNSSNSRIRPPKSRHALAASSLLPDSTHTGYDTGIDSPTYDGDIESSTTAGAEPSHSSNRYPASIASTLTSPITPATHPADSDLPPQLDLPSSPSTFPLHTPPSKPQPEARQPHYLDLLAEQSLSASLGSEPHSARGPTDAFSPAKLTPEDIQEFIRRAVAREGPEHAARSYRINPPPTDRPVRIYADGVYDLFHFGHALQLRQAKLSFPPILSTSSSPSPSSIPTLLPGVHLLVGVNTDESCIEHKNRTVMTHAERCEAVRHCRWVDEVIPEAPWVIDGDFIEKYQIDYVAHDEDPYASGGHDDVYAFAKHQGKFLPTRRTPLISTSDLLERIVTFYRLRVFDKKLEKMGHRELMAEGSDWDDSAEGSRAPSGRVSRDERRG